MTFTTQLIYKEIMYNVKNTNQNEGIAIVEIGYVFLHTQFLLTDPSPVRSRLSQEAADAQSQCRGFRG